MLWVHQHESALQTLVGFGRRPGGYRGGVVAPTSVVNTAGFYPGRHPGSSSVQMSQRMSRVKRRDNGPEMAVRRLLHARGFRYRVAWPVPGQRRRTIDIAFSRAKVAIYIDGCFWHGCPVHETSPKANSDWWAEKIRTNRARDADVTAQLKAMGWTVMRFWEHEEASLVVEQSGALISAQGT